MSVSARGASGPGPHVLREYALIADGERGAIIGPRGDIAWLCAPRWDSPAVFGALIGGHGSYLVAPSDPFVWGGYYEPGTLIWRNRWVTTSGVIECRDTLAFPADSHRVVILRRIIALDGAARLHVSLDVRAGYGRQPMVDVARDHGIWTARSGPLWARWQGADQAHGGHPLSFELTVPDGHSHDLVLEISDQPLADPPPDPAAVWHATEAGWHTAIPRMTDCLFPAEVAQHYAVLRGLTSAGGGMVAAATTSLPERAEAGRNYDYRYVWIRDQCYAGQAVAALGAHSLLDDAVRFVTAQLLEHGPRLAPAYTTTGASVPDERHLDLPGYPGGYDIVGNWVNQQFQLDAFGEALLLLTAAAAHDRLDGQGWRAAEAAAAAIAARWSEPDAGIWEIDDRAWTHSRLTASAGLRAIAGVRQGSVRAAEWVALADHILADTTQHALHPDGYWQRSPADPALDAALLWPALRGGVPGSDPRTKATLHAYLRALTQDGYAYRFRQDARPLGQAEGSFLLCGFLVALCLRQQGKRLDARAWYERTRAACGAPQLFSEEYDVRQHQMRGNLPQAFVHALMIEASARLAR